MSTSTVSDIFNGGVTVLVSYFSTILPIVIPVLIGVAFIFFVYHLVVNLAHKR